MAQADLFYLNGSFVDISNLLFKVILLNNGLSFEIVKSRARPTGQKHSGWI